MIRITLLASALVAQACTATAVLAPAEAAELATAEVGKAAPDFSLPGVDGKTYSLADAKGKTVVLEWYNPDCPFVKYAHGEGGPLRELGNTHADAGIVWWAINSGAPGNQGHGLDRNKASLDEYGIRYPVLLDEAGTVGHLYGAKTTPHMFVIDPNGVLVYAGGLDNAPFGKLEGGAYQSYVNQAISAVAEGEPVRTPKAKHYGCSVKY